MKYIKDIGSSMRTLLESAQTCTRTDNRASSAGARGTVSALSSIQESISVSNKIFNHYYCEMVRRMFHLITALILSMAFSLYAGAADELGHHHVRDDGAGVAYKLHSNNSRKVVFSTAQLGEPLAAIAGGCVEVTTLLGSGTDPHLYRLTRSDVLHLHKADTIGSVGLHLEVQMDSILEDMSAFKAVYNVGDLLPKERLMEVSPMVYDPHLWMDPTLWGEGIKAVSDKIAMHFPDCKDKIMAGLDAYLKELNELDAQAAQVFKYIPKEKRVLVTSHDAFGYFGRKYDIKVLAIQGISTDRQISVRRISNLVDFLVDNKVSVVFVESSVNPRDMHAVIEGAASRGYKITIGGTLYSDAMGAEGTEEGTYLGMLRHNIQTVLEAWGVYDSRFSPPPPSTSFL